VRGGCSFCLYWTEVRGGWTKNDNSLNFFGHEIETHF
jgi:hypothetical protein